MKNGYCSIHLGQKTHLFYNAVHGTQIRREIYNNIDMSASTEQRRDELLEGVSESKKQCVEEEDLRMRAMLAMSRYCQEQWVRKMIRLHISRGDDMKLALLSGDAGCGKSYAISLLEKKLRSMNISVVVSAMTNKAAGTLRDSCSLDCVYTFHKMMGFRKELLDDTLSLEDFTGQYCKVYGNLIFRFNTLHQSELPPERNEVIKRHSCKQLRPESCAVCSKMFMQLKVSKNPTDLAPMEGAPPFLGANVLIIDEYGLMNVEIFERMLCCIALFYGPGKGPLIVLAGSVSQLQPVGTKLRIWETERFEGLLSSSTPLFVNRRQFKDPGYAEALTYLQFNTVTEESQRIFRSQVSVREPDIMNPEYEPQKLRVFHQDEQQRTYTAAYMDTVTKKVRVGDKFISVAKNRSYNGPHAWYEVLKQAAQTLPKLFSVPKYRQGIRSTERDYLKVDKLWIGCKVRMIWHMDINGIEVVNKKTSPSSSALLGKQRGVQHQLSFADTEGVVKDICFMRENQYNVFYVKGSQTGTLYKVRPSKWHYMNWTVSTHPLACLLAMNTYDCQGCTVQGQVLYHPPRHFAMSPIKPSVYVVLSRVVQRQNLQMTNCNFAEKVGAVYFYNDKLVTYRKRVEMNYSR